MGLPRWDRVPEVWKLCLDLLAPGGYLCAFGGSRTHHRLATAIEDAGFEVRDTLVWLHSQGFPKSLNVSAAIDRKLGAASVQQGYGKSVARLSTVAGFAGDRGQVYERIQIPITAPASPQAHQWAGYGTALKSAVELIVLARKPLSGTVAENVLEYGVGGLNIDGCRVEGPMDGVWGTSNATIALDDDGGRMFNASPGARDYRTEPHPAGRWPANFLHDGSPEVLDGFPNSKGSQAKGVYRRVTGSIYDFYSPETLAANEEYVGRGYCDDGSAARYFYCAKASKAERNGSKHPTVKPLALMRWLIRLVTPPGGLVLDPFAGTGTTGEAARREGRDYILIEKDPAYFDDLKNRLAPQFIAERRLA